jgi:hypothetical protein
MRQVPLSGRVIFSDWHGVLSRDPFWVSICGSATHSLHARLEAGMAGVFASGQDTATDWMKGLLSSDQVITDMGIQLDRRFRDDFLARRLDIDCAIMAVNAELFEVLRAVRAEAMVVVATDNMDCFARAFERARSRPRRRARPRETLADWAVICDDIICSSQAGTLKSEDPQTFFGPWLAAHGLGFADAVLIDDRADNCQAFTSQGGAAIQWKMGTHATGEAISQLEQWLDRQTRQRLPPAKTRRSCTIPMTLAGLGCFSAHRRRGEPDFGRGQLPARRVGQVDVQDVGEQHQVEQDVGHFLARPGSQRLGLGQVPGVGRGQPLKELR